MDKEVAWKDFESLTFALAGRNVDCEYVYGIPTGGCFVSRALCAAYDIEHLSNPPVCPDENILIVDDLVASGKTLQPWIDKGFKVDALFRKPFSPSHIAPNAPLVNGWVKFPWEHETGPEDAVVRLLDFVGENPNREGLVETPSRVVKAWKEWTEGYGMDPATCFKAFGDGAENYDEMISLDPIAFNSHCEHHLAAIFGNVYISYIPNKRIAGLSKFCRLVDIFAKRLQVQERLTTQIADAIMEHLQPLGVGVSIKARHFCMESRGVKKSGVYTTTTALRGVIKEDPNSRSEFLAITNRR